MNPSKNKIFVSLCKGKSREYQTIAVQAVEQEEGKHNKIVGLVVLQVLHQPLLGLGHIAGRPEGGGLEKVRPGPDGLDHGWIDAG